MVEQRLPETYTSEVKHIEAADKAAFSFLDYFNFMIYVYVLVGLMTIISMWISYWKARYQYLVKSGQYLEKFMDAVDEGCERLGVVSLDDFNVESVHSITEIYLFMALLEAEGCVTIMVNDVIKASRIPIKFNRDKFKEKHMRFLPIFNAVKMLTEVDNFEEMDKEILGVID